MSRDKDIRGLPKAFPPERNAGSLVPRWIPVAYEWNELEQGNESPLRMPHDWDVVLVFRADESNLSLVELTTLDTRVLSSPAQVACAISMFFDAYAKLLPQFASGLRPESALQEGWTRVHTARVVLNCEASQAGLREADAIEASLLIGGMLLDLFRGGETQSGDESDTKRFILPPGLTPQPDSRTAWRAGDRRVISLKWLTLTVSIQLAVTDAAKSTRARFAPFKSELGISDALQQMDEVRQQNHDCKESARIAVQTFLDQTRESLAPDGHFPTREDNLAFVRSFNLMLRESGLRVENEDGLRGTLVCIRVAGQNAGYFVVQAKKKGKTVRSSASRHLPHVSIVHAIEPPAVYESDTSQAHAVNSSDR
ncbi:MAG: hypothetical protein ACF8MF_04930 [Phycisphaerales bacterium JB052]